MVEFLRGSLHRPHKTCQRFSGQFANLIANHDIRSVNGSFLGRISAADETTTVAHITVYVMTIDSKSNNGTRFVVDSRRNAAVVSYIIYSMLLSEHLCQITSVGEVKDSKGFKKCFVRVKTKEKRDDVSNEVIRASGEFDCEVALNDLTKHAELTKLASYADPAFVPCTFLLRSFWYKEKGIDKLGKQLQLKRWWR